jgi:hypothetical protein
MKFPTMTVQRHASYSTGTVRIDISHHVAQSFSRSVDPRAMREARNMGLNGSWELHDAHYGVETVGDVTRSSFLFRTIQ